MTQDASTAAASSRGPASLWPTGAGLSVLFLGGLYIVRSTESGMVVAVDALLAMMVTFVGVLGHGLSGLWRAFRGRGAFARNSFLRAGLYLLFGVASFTATRLQGGTVEEFRSGLQPGMTVDETLRRLDALYTQHPKRWRFISLWGTKQELSIGDYRKIGEPGDGAVLFMWQADQSRTSAAMAEAAAALSKTRQVWFTLRTDVGFVHFFVTVDEGGRIKSVSETTGHQA